MAALRTSASAGADGPVVVLSGEADATTAVQLREMLAAQLETGARRVTVDASGLSFLDSASVRVLVLAARALRGRHGTLVLARPQPVVTRLLEITGADRLLDVRELAGRARPRAADQDAPGPGRAAALPQPRGPGAGAEGSDIAVSIEPATADDRVSVLARACGLSPRETELVRHLAAGGDTREVAGQMFVSENTVQDHLKSVFAKTGCRSRRTLLARALGT